MAVLPIREFGDPVLRKKAKRVIRVNKGVRDTLDTMLDTMRAVSGAGLAAPQIGLSRRLVVIDTGEGPYSLINPEIIDRSEETETAWEGCLSWPGYVGEVERHARVSVKALDRDGHETWIEGEGLLARALQHEIDHLDGILYIDRATMVKEVPQEGEPDESTGEDKRVTTVFMGSPEFAVPSLERMVNSGVTVKLVVTQPDRPAGRKLVPQATAVKEAAVRLGIPVLECLSVSDPDVVARIREMEPDFITVVAFGQKIPKELLELPRFACLNLHPSLLPKYRGGNPVQRAVIAGDKITGVSVIYMSEKMDAGDICLQKTVEIGSDETYGTLEKRLADLGAHCLVEAMSGVLSGTAGRTAQDDSKASRAPHLRKGEEIIDWTLPARSIHNLVRGLSPRPGAVTFWDGIRIKIWETHMTTLESEDDPGTVVRTEDDFGLVSCGVGVLQVKLVQPEGKKPMSFRAFMIGRSKGSAGLQKFG